MRFVHILLPKWIINQILPTLMKHLDLISPMKYYKPISTTFNETFRLNQSNKICQQTHILGEVCVRANPKRYLTEHMGLWRLKEWISSNTYCGKNLDNITYSLGVHALLYCIIYNMVCDSKLLLQHNHCSCQELTH